MGRDSSSRLFRAAFLLAALGIGSCSSPSPPRENPPAPIVLAGAEHMVPWLRGEVLAFRDQHPDAPEIRIVDNGSAEGMEQLVNNEVTMSVLTREVTDPEVKAAYARNGLNAIAVAWDGIAVIVNPSAPVRQISRTELGEIYRGTLTDWADLGWKGGGQIAALTTGPRLGLFEFIQQALLGGDAYGPGIYAQKSEADIVDIVATRPNAIGCVSKGFVDARVRTLAVSSAIGFSYASLTRESLMLRTYPLLRGISLCTGARPREAVNDFVNFVTSVDGQRIVAKYGYAPATVSVRVVRTAEEAQ